MRRIAVACAFALALAIAPLTTASAVTPPPTITPPGPNWVYWGEYPLQWICYDVGNQQMFTYQYQRYACTNGDPGEFALWLLPN